MAVMATDAWTARSRSKGMARYVGHLLCDYVNQSRAEAGYDWEAWPSQGTLAKKANCSSRAIRRALAELKRIGEIEDTGRFKGRGCRVYAITLPEPTPDGSVQGEESPPRTEVSGVDGSVQGEGVKSGQVGRKRPQNRKGTRNKNQKKNRKVNTGPALRCRTFSLPPHRQPASPTTAARPSLTTGPPNSST